MNARHARFVFGLAIPVTALLALGMVTSALAGGVGIVNTVVSDNGDDDGFADTRETVSVRLTVQNTSGIALSNVVARFVADDPLLACVTVPTIDVGGLAIGEVKLTDSAFVFTIGDLDRGALGLGPLDDLSVAFSVVITSEPLDQEAYPSKLVFDVDLDVSGGAGPTTYFESFEDGMGSFEVQNLDQGKSNLEASDGYRCQYNDPDWVNSNNYGVPQFSDECFLANSAAHADREWWGISGPETSPLGGRGFSGFHSLFFGDDVGPPRNWTTPVSILEAAGMSEPVHLGWSAGSATLSFVQQVSLADSRFFALDDGESYDRGVVMAQVADDQGDPAGPWIKIYPYQNVYDQQNAPFIFNCTYDPIDDGSTEDDFFDPGDPLRRYGPSSTCWPEFTFVNIGETSSLFDPQNIGRADGPGLQGIWGIGTWIESKFDLGRFRGRSIRVRFLAVAVEAGDETIETWDDLFDFNPDPNDDGWWVDDVTISNTLGTAAAVSVDTKDNSSLPDPAGGDGDSDQIGDACDNCPAGSNTDQADQDSDGTGDICDACPADPDDFDPDADTVCGALDNCPFDANPAQTDVDADGAGVPCDCNDADATTFPGASEVNDGQDNQCPGDAGHGVTDEISGVTGFFDAQNRNLYSWPAQPGAARYRVARADSATFSSGCMIFTLTNATSQMDPAQPATQAVFFYMVRAALPNVGSWGQDSAGLERSVPCDSVP